MAQFKDRSNFRDTYEKFKQEYEAKYSKTGRTTRLLDDAVQTFFCTGIVRLKDHKKDKKANQRFFKKFIDRLELEHKDFIDDMKSQNMFHASLNTLTVRISQK